VLPYPPTQKTRARQLRTTQTDAETKLWGRLRSRQLCNAKFRRQHPIGPFIADCCCVEAGVVVELDGSQHADELDRDKRRTEFMERSGYRVVRFWDNEVLENIDAVLEQIIRALTEPSPFPLPKGEGKNKSKR
jgi:very-short-patch-repair endonuclease